MATPLNNNGKSKAVNEYSREEMPPLPKRRKNNSNYNATINDDLDSNLIQQYATTSISGNTKNSAFEKTQHEILNEFKEQKIDCKKLNDNLNQNLLVLLKQLNEDQADRTENEDSLQEIITAQQKCLSQCILAFEKRSKELQNFQSQFKSKLNELNKKHETEIYKLSEEIIKKYRE